MIHIVLGLAIVSHLVPSAISWTWWGATTAVQGTYWLVYGRHEARRMRQAVRDEIADRLHNLELVVGGTDVILVPRKI